MARCSRLQTVEDGNGLNFSITNIGMENVTDTNIIHRSTAAVETFFIAVFSEESLCVVNHLACDRRSGFHVVLGVDANIPVLTSSVQLLTLCQFRAKNTDKFILETGIGIINCNLPTPVVFLCL